MKYGFYETQLCVDEMMVKSYAKTSLKQFIRGKPIRFGIKLWRCTSDGFLLNLDLYCGKNGNSLDKKLNGCALGTRVLMNLLKPLLFRTRSQNRSMYNVYFDNYFTSLDLVLHLKKLGLGATGTI